MTLLDRVVELLSSAGVRHALIGAAALAAHGVSRSTFDRDLLTTDRRVLQPSLWTPLAPVAAVDVRTGDAEDPLAGVVRLSSASERDVDVIVGRHPWQEAALERARPVGAGALRVVQPADLILLKLYAGGTQDRWDVEQLLAIDASMELPATVDAQVGVLPPAARELWAAIRRGRA